MTKAFPSLDEDELPDLPMFMEMTPDGEYWWVAGLVGQIYQVRALSNNKITRYFEV